jgi:glucose-6-phosphate dehydrogenase assembly protein OpcA
MMAIDVTTILHELYAGQEGCAGATTSTLTLLAYCDDSAILEWMRERARAIGQMHPARIVMLDATAAPSLHETETFTSASHIACGEWIDVGIRGISPASLAAIARALTVRDVPSVLAWGGREMLTDPAFLALNACADSLILDSSRVGSDLVALRELTEYFSSARRLAVQDLAYQRLAPWQETIALFFDDSDLALELHELRRVGVTAGSQAEAYYLLGWLASRLGWKVDGPGKFVGIGGEPIAYSVAMQGEPRRVRSVELGASDETVFRVALDENDDTLVCMSVDGPKKRRPHCEPIHDVSIVALIEHAILWPDTSEVFRSTIEATRSILDVA